MNCVCPVLYTFKEIKINIVWWCEDLKITKYYWLLKEAATLLVDNGRIECNVKRLFAINNYWPTSQLFFERAISTLCPHKYSNEN